MTPKVLHLLSLLPQRPVEFYDRVVEFTGKRFGSIVHTPPAYRAVHFEEALRGVLGGLHSDPLELLREKALLQLEERVTKRKAELPTHAPFAREHDGDTTLGRLCYAVVRAFCPATVVETGVCYGVTSAYLLAALEANQTDARLYSVDLPPLGKDGADYVGWLVPSELRRRWTLWRGRSSRLLGPLVRKLGTVDVFVHDSLHTPKNMSTEFRTVWPALRPGGVLISDDIEGHDAFQQLTRSSDVEYSAVIHEKSKSALIGLAVKRK